MEICTESASIGNIQGRWKVDEHGADIVEFVTAPFTVSVHFPVQDRRACQHAIHIDHGRCGFYDCHEVLT